MILAQTSLMNWLEEVPEALILTSPHGDIIYANLKAQATLSIDLTTHQMLDDIFSMLESMGNLTRSLIRLRPSEETRLLVRLRQDLARTFSVALRRSNLNEYILISLREEIDLLDRFEPIRDELESYRLLAHNIPNCAVILFDRDMRYIIADGVALEAAGYTSEQFLGKTLYEALPDSVDSLEPIYRKALAGELHDAVVYSTEGGIYESTVIPVKDRHGDIHGGMLFILDISDRHMQLNQLDVQERSLKIYAQHMKAMQLLLTDPAPPLEAIASMLDIPEIDPRQDLQPLDVAALLHEVWRSCQPPDYLVPFINKPELETVARGYPPHVKLLLREMLSYMTSTLPRTHDSPLTFEVQYAISLGMLSLKLSHRHATASRHTLPQTPEALVKQLIEHDEDVVSLLRLRHLVLSCRGTLHTAHSANKARIVLNLQLNDAQPG